MVNSTLALSFPAVGRKEVVACFDGGDITSDAGALLVAAADRRLGLTEALVAAIDDRREASQVTHPLVELLRTRVFAIALGYEDANDLDRLRQDPALKAACGRLPQTGWALASQPTISRLENMVVTRDLVRLGRALAGVVISGLPRQTRTVVIDLDPTDDPCHGQQELELFNGFYGEHCYLPLHMYVTADGGRQQVVGAVLRAGNAATTAGARTLLRRLVRLLRARCPAARITLRADSGFGIEEVLECCEELAVEYVLGLAKNPALQRLSTPVQMDAALGATYRQAGAEGIECGEFPYQAKTWPQPRRVIAKVEVTRGELNPRYVVTSWTTPSPWEVYRFYCGRGDPENRIKELKVGLASGRTSCHRFLANQFRLLLHVAAYVLLQAVQAALAGTGWAAAQVETVRTRLLKVGARVVETCRKVWVHLPTACPVQQIWAHLCQRLC
jgi:hypothetical protein